LIAGDRWVWKRTDLGSDYDPDDYALTYSARLDGAGATEIEITASESGNNYIVEVASATTAAYSTGRYKWHAYITRTSDSERVTIGTGYFEVKEDNAESTADPRTHAKITLDAIESAIQALNFGASSYSINGRSYTSRNLDELESMRSRYKGEVAREERKASGKGGNKLVYKL